MVNYGDDIIRYLKGEMSVEEMHELERKALSDPLLAEALEGAASIRPEDLRADLNELHARVTGEKQSVSFWSWPMRIAATVILLVAATFGVYQFLKTEPASHNELALQTNKNDSAEEQASPKIEQAPAVQEQADQPTSAESRIENQNQENSSSQAEQVTPESASPVQKPAAEPTPESIPPVQVPLNDVPANQSSPAGAGAPAQMDMDKLSAAPSSSRAISREPTQAMTVRGKVRGTDDNMPLPGAEVGVEGGNKTVTDAEGNYLLTVPDSNATLAAEFLGYKKTSMPIDGRSEINFNLDPAVAQLKELNVAGYTAESKEGITNPVPTSGQAAYIAYLTNNVSYPARARNNGTEGLVIIEFTVQPNGRLADFTTVQGIGNGCEQEVTRVVKNGPAWKPAEQDGTPVPHRVQVQYEFRLPR